MRFRTIPGKEQRTSMENLQTETLYLHEGHEDEYGEEEDGMPMDEDHPLWRSERITLNSVGINIGSSTSHLIFSRLTLRRQGIALSSRFVVVNREIIHESPILLTPYVDKTTIDTDKLGEFIHESYRQTGLTPNDIDTGAVIVTGEAAKKKNAEAIAALFSAEAGKFVCASAGHNLEAILASYGSGAVHMTYHEGGDFTVMNVDIGGGTCKIAIVQQGKVIDTCALEVGARLVAMDENGKINRLEDTALKIAKMAGISCRSRPWPPGAHRDRKSTRLNSSHITISYAVFCLKKKKKTITHTKIRQNRAPAGGEMQIVVRTKSAHSRRKKSSI